MKKDISHANDVIHRLILWAEQQASVRAMLLTSTRANPDSLVDIFSDYDVILVVQDIHPFYQDRSWLQDFGTVVHEFFSEAPYVAKCLWRDELMPAKWCLDYAMKHKYLRQMLEWRLECDHNWSAPVGTLGKGLKNSFHPLRAMTRLPLCGA